MLVRPIAVEPFWSQPAGLVHTTVSLFWALVFGALLPRRHVAPCSVLGARCSSRRRLDLRVIAPAFFPSFAALAFCRSLPIIWCGAPASDSRYRCGSRDRPLGRHLQPGASIATVGACAAHRRRAG